MNEYFKSVSDFLFEDIKKDDVYEQTRPILAHYTSLSTLENILKNDEVWLSNPLFMNDLDEVRFGMLNGFDMVKLNKSIIESLGSEDRFSAFISNFNHYFDNFIEENAMDTYVLCLSEHNADDRDGVLSMWRAYASNGNGAAIVVDTSKLPSDDDSAFVVAPVRYSSSQDRMKWLGDICEKTADFLRGNTVPTEELYNVAYSLFERIKLFSLFTKHSGFSEEKEWRIVYMPERDGDKKYQKMLGYFNGPRGVEPKLKLKFNEDTPPPLNIKFSDIIASIILGPTTSSVLAVSSVKRMLEVIGKPELKERLVASTIPLRPS